MTVPHRCSNRYCRTRKTFKKPWWEYVRVPKCPTCGRQQWVIPSDMHRGYKWRRVCRCGGLDFPHKIGCRGCYERDELHSDHQRDGPEDDTGFDEQLARDNGYVL